LRKTPVIVAAVLSVAMVGVVLIWPMISGSTHVESRQSFTSKGQSLVGTLLHPAGDPKPVVLLLHGFTSSGDGLATNHVRKGIFAHVAHRLADAGYASFRVDFRGSGESVADLSFADTTFEGQVADGLAAVNYLQALASVDADQVSIVGISQGGLIGAAVAARSESVQKLALWNAVAYPRSTYARLLGADALDRGAAADPNQPIEATTPWGKTITLNGAFYHQVHSFDPLAEVAAFSGSLLVVQGEKDDVVDPGSAVAYMNAHAGTNELIMMDMDHLFNVSSTAKMLDLIIDQSVRFFNVPLEND